ncbi:coiled-coil domain-containing protein 96-like [Rhagoletis pomonella]|uniref:coiled-coil domain-containing protein 96-like n=1 Tax=Rhagoletis pomonella TaxID=28610 RepID=UPI00177F4EE0|nr:coiled-coil domain-containing protein 96-like [Rhagoletis pomonella]
MEEQCASMPDRFTDFDNRDIIRQSQGLPTDKHDYQQRKIQVNVPANHLGEPENMETTDMRPSTPKHLSRYRRYSEKNDDYDLGDEPFDDAHWESDEPPDHVEEKLYELGGGMRLGLLEQLTEMPDIDEISSSISEETIGLDNEKPERLQQSDNDFELDFVDMKEYAEEEKEQLAEFAITEDNELLELEKWDADQEQSEETKLAHEKEEMSDFELFVTTKEPEFDQALLQDTRQQNEAIVTAFVEELIQLVVEAAEYKDTRDVLRKSIDKRKLMDEISEKLRELEIEQSARLYLNRKVVDHLKRKRQFHAIIEDPAESVEYWMAKYREQLQKYDEMLGKEEELKRVTTTKMIELNEILKEREHRYEEEAKEFERIVRKALLPHEGTVNTKKMSKKSAKYKDYLKNINAMLNEISTKRKEISNTRLMLIKKQHLFAELKERLSEIGNVGHGPNVTQFENLQNEVEQLSKKLEDRNTELAKARLQRQLDVHISTHMKERMLMLRNTLAVQRLSYSTWLQKRQETRRALHQQQMIRTQIRKDIKELDFQGGILSKPALMLDYDNTVAEVGHKQEIVRGLHFQYKKISEKIAKYEQMLASGVPNKLKVND